MTETSLRLAWEMIMRITGLDNSLVIRVPQPVQPRCGRPIPSGT